MTTFTIDEQNQIMAFATAEEAAAATATPFDTFATQQELAELAAHWPGERLPAIWNTLPGVSQVNKFQDRKTAVRRIWERLQKLETPASPQTPTVGPQSAHGAPRKATSTRKATAAKPVRKAKTRMAPDPTAPRDGSKAAQVVALLRRKNGATITEIMDKMRWQKHTVRGFMAGAMKKAGYQVESFKPEGGTRSYRLPQ